MRETAKGHVASALSFAVALIFLAGAVLTTPDLAVRETFLVRAAYFVAAGGFFVVGLAFWARA